ncbi:MAG: response regulator [Rhodospirillaceae bacterium]|mgnify:CR=1 FL=1|jgi:CheY-like chemotaxis protein|nr:response regulator [Rhodospirillaceae bacterium]MBT4940745.1 response regulator [Rhodospirillaceae bacterium]MBT5939974.1 response regulator [Rhodospirillaceae bacterium]MBT7267129.1 response regulator [Rhodospirillaceae bacterium]
MAHILIADDDQIILDLTRHWLEQGGHSVAGALSGQDAQRQLCAGSFDLLITDLAMPNVDGIELIQDVKKLMPALKILAMSGKDKTGTGILKAAKVLGADSTISKPLEQVSFVEAAEALLS